MSDLPERPTTLPDPDAQRGVQPAPAQRPTPPDQDPVRGLEPGASDTTLGDADATRGVQPEPAPVAELAFAPALLEARAVHKSYWLGEKEIHVLRGASFAVRAGEMASLVGPSGVGKSTFLHVIGTLDPPTQGTVLLDGADTGTMSEEQLARFRNQTVGFVFQFHYLLPEFTALQNASMPGLIHRLKRDEAEQRAREMLEMVGLGHRLDHRPGELSGGEQQRVALARALVLGPRLLLADEPTGNLDEETGEGIHQLLVELNRRLGIAMIVVTHNARLAERMPRRLRLSEGLVVDAV